MFDLLDLFTAATAENAEDMTMLEKL